MNGRCALAAAGLAMSVAAGVMAGPIEVIYTKKPGHAKAVVPGTVDLTGSPEAVEWKAFEDLALSPDGSRWIIKARSTAAADHDTLIVAGGGTTGAAFSAGGLVMQEGRPCPTAGGGTDGFIDFIPTGFGRFDDNNKLVFGLRARTTQTGSTATPDAMRVCTWDGTTIALAFKMLDPYTGLQDTGVGSNISGDEQVGNSVGSFHLLNNGTIGSQDSTVVNIFSTRRPVLTYNRTLFQQINVTSVTALGGVGTVTWTALVANAFYTTPDGAHWWAVGSAGSPAAEVFVYDGQVRIQAGAAIGASSVIAGATLQVQMASTGAYIARGRDNSLTTAAAPDWVVLNGTLIAKTGDSITPGSSEHWGDTIYAVAINRTGDYIIAGNTDSGNAASDNVIVLNGTTVVMREGDPVDLNGNGINDDGVFIGRANNTLTAFTASVNNGQTAWWLTDGRVLYGLPMLVDVDGIELTTSPAFGSPHAFVRLSVGCPADFNGQGGVTVQDIFDFLAAYFANSPSADFNGVGGITVQDIFDFLAAYFTGCP